MWKLGEELEISIFEYSGERQLNFSASFGAEPTKVAVSSVQISVAFATDSRYTIKPYFAGKWPVRSLIIQNQKASSYRPVRVPGCSAQVLEDMLVTY
jgi:hypothetical protein